MPVRGYVKLVDFDDSAQERAVLLRITLRCVWMCGAPSEQRFITMYNIAHYNAHTQQRY